MRLRQEISHPAGVRLQLRKKDVQSSLALADLFGCVWVVGWKQRDYPVLFNAFHIGDQVISVSGVLIRSSSEFSKLVKLKSADLHTEIIIRRAPFGQVFYLKPDIEGQSLGLILANATAEVKEVLPGSVAAAAGVPARVRSLDGASVAPLVLTEINGRYEGFDVVSPNEFEVVLYLNQMGVFNFVDDGSLPGNDRMDDEY